MERRHAHGAVLPQHGRHPDRDRARDRRRRPTTTSRRSRRRFANGESTTEPSTYYPSPYLGGALDHAQVLRLHGDRLDGGARHRRRAARQSGSTTSTRWGATRCAPAPTRPTSSRRSSGIPGAAVRMVNALRLGGVEVERATAPFTAGGRDVRRRLVRHPRRAAVPALRARSAEPAGLSRSAALSGRPARAAVRHQRLDAQLSDGRARRQGRWRRSRRTTERVSDGGAAAGAVTGSGDGAFALDPRTNDAFIAVNRLLKAGDAVYRATGAAVDAGGAPCRRARSSSSPARRPAAGSTRPRRARAVRGGARRRRPRPASSRLRPPRVGLYNAWGGNIDEGWTRWVLEQYEFPYTTLRDADIRAGSLRQKFDVILLPDAVLRQHAERLRAGDDAGRVHGRHDTARRRQSLRVRRRGRHRSSRRTTPASCR